MEYITTPITSLDGTAHAVNLRRANGDIATMLDNLVELIVFTPRGSFTADPDFGFEYWNHEYSNVKYRDFNNGHPCSLDNAITRQLCQESVVESLRSYAPMLLDITCSIELDIPSTNKRYKNITSKYMVNVVINGRYRDGMDYNDYRKVVTFMVEPTVKTRFN